MVNEGQSTKDCFIFSKDDLFCSFLFVSFAGDRNVDKVYPNDPYGEEEHWPGGIGELTNVKN